MKRVKECSHVFRNKDTKRHNPYGSVNVIFVLKKPFMINIVKKKKIKHSISANFGIFDCSKLMVIHF